MIGKKGDIFIVFLVIFIVLFCCIKYVSGTDFGLNLPVIEEENDTVNFSIPDEPIIDDPEIENIIPEKLEPSINDPIVIQEELINESVSNIQFGIQEDIPAQDLGNDRYLPSVVDRTELKIMNYKFANISGVIISTPQQVTCYWKPDNLDDGFKTCESIIEFENLGAFNGFVNAPRFNNFFEKNTGRDFNMMYSNTFNLINKSYIGKDDNKVTTNFTFKMRDYNNFVALPNKIDITKPFAINLTYEAPKYEENHFNFSLDNLNMQIDPDQGACGNLGAAGIYTLTADLEDQDTCLSISNNNVWVDCNGHLINYSLNGASQNKGIMTLVSVNNITIQNCLIYEGNITGHENSALDFSGNDYFIDNNTLVTFSNGTYTFNSFNTGLNVTNNSIQNNGEHSDDNGANAHAFYYYDANDAYFFNNNFDVVDNIDYSGFVGVLGNDNLIFENNTIDGFDLFGGGEDSNFTDNLFLRHVKGSSAYYAVFENNTISATIYGDFRLSNFTTNNFTSPTEWYDASVYGLSDCYFLNNFFDLSSSGSAYNAQGGNNTFKENDFIVNSTVSGVILNFNADNNLFLNNNFTNYNGSFTFLDETDGTYNNTLMYNNSYGQINWSGPSTGTNLTINGSLIFGSNVFIGQNVASINTTPGDLTTAIDLSTSSSYAHVALMGLSYDAIDVIYKLSTYSENLAEIFASGETTCLSLDACNKISYGGGILEFNTTGFSSFSGGPDEDNPTIADFALNETNININESVYLNTTVYDDSLVDTVWFDIQPFGNLTATKSGIEYYVLCNATNDCNTTEVGSYNWTSIWANDTVNNQSISYPDLQFNVTTDIKYCGYVNDPGNYLLANDISSTGNCLYVNSSDVLIDCQGYDINYSYGAVTGYGINNSDGYSNITIKNCDIYEGESTTSSKIGIYSQNFDSFVIEDTNITTIGSNSWGLYFYVYNYTNITNVNITANADFVSGVMLYYGAGDSVYENSSTTMTGSGNNNQEALILYYVNNTDFVNNEFYAGGETGTDGEAVYGYKWHFNDFFNNTMNASGSGYGLYYTGTDSGYYNQFAENNVSSNSGYGAYIASNFYYSNYTQNNFSSYSNYGFVNYGLMDIFIENNFSSISSYSFYLVGSDDLFYDNYFYSGNSISFYLHDGDRNLLMNNTFVTGSSAIVDGSGNGDLNYLTYNNSFGQINWTDESSGGFLDDLGVVGNLSLDDDLFIGSNVSAVNTSIGESNFLINSSVEITMTGLDLYDVKIIKFLENYTTNSDDINASGISCIANENCTIISYDAVSGILVFNSTFLGSFTVSADYDNPTILSEYLTPSENYINYSVTLNASAIDDSAVDTVWFDIEPFGNLTAIKSGDEYSIVCNATNDCNTTEAGSYNWTSIWANDTANNQTIYLPSDPYTQFNLSVWPEVVVTLVNPVTNANFTQNLSNTFTVNVSCSMNDCGEVNFTLDPEASTIYFGDNGGMVHKVDSSGNQISNFTLADGSHDIYDLAFDSSDNIYVGAYNFNPEGILAKYDSFDNQLWNVTIASFISGVAVDSSDNVIIGMYSDWPYFMNVLKYDSSGAMVWNSTTYSGYQPYDVAVDNSDNIYVATYFSTTSVADLIKLDSSGNYQWNTTFTDGMGGQWYGFSVGVDSSDNVYFAPCRNMGGGRICYLVKYDSNGNQLWNTSVNNAEYSSVAVDSSDNIYLGWYSNMISGGGINQYQSDGNNPWNYTPDKGYIWDVAADDAVYGAGYNRSDVWAMRGFGNKLDNTGAEKWNYTGNDFTNTFYSVAVPRARGKTIVPMDAGTPFWTSVTNPYNITLNKDDSELITWLVNATGELDSIYEFYVYGNMTTQSDFGNETDRINITISEAVDSTSPMIFNLSAESYSGISGTEFRFNATVNDSESGIDIVNISIQNPDDNEITPVQLSSTLGTGDDFNGTWDSVAKPTGVYYVDISANDTVGNEITMDNMIGLILVPAGTTVNTFINQSFDTTMLVAKTIDAQSDCDIQVDLFTTVDINNCSTFIACFNKNVESSTTGFASKELGKYFAVIVNDDINLNLTTAQIRLYYTDAEVSAAGIDETTLRLYKFNDTTGEWSQQSGGVNTALNYVYADVTSFSSFGAGGSASSIGGTTATTSGSSQAGGGGGAGGSANGEVGKIFNVDKNSFNIVLGINEKKKESLNVIHEGDLSFDATVSSDLGDNLEIDDKAFTLKPRETKEVGLNFIAGDVAKIIDGSLFIKNEEQVAEIPVKIEVVEQLDDSKTENFIDLKSNKKNNLFSGFSVFGSTELKSNIQYYIITTLILAVIVGFFVQKWKRFNNGPKNLGSLQEVGTRLEEVFNFK